MYCQCEIYADRWRIPHRKPVCDGHGAGQSAGSCPHGYRTRCGLHYFTSAWVIEFEICQSRTKCDIHFVSGTVRIILRSCQPDMRYYASSYSVSDLHSVEFFGATQRRYGAVDYRHGRNDCTSQQRCDLCERSQAWAAPTGMVLDDSRDSMSPAMLSHAAVVCWAACRSSGFSDAGGLWRGRGLLHSHGRGDAKWNLHGSDCGNFRQHHTHDAAAA